MLPQDTCNWIRHDAAYGSLPSSSVALHSLSSTVAEDEAKVELVLNIALIVYLFSASIVMIMIAIFLIFIDRP